MKADWKKPLGPLLVPPDAMEGIALMTLEAMLRREVRWVLTVLSPLIRTIDRGLKIEPWRISH